jgi:hypothetical protein
MDGFHRDQAAASGSPFYRAFLASSGTGGVTEPQGLASPRVCSGRGKLL